MKITLNGEPRELSDASTVNELLIELGYEGRRLAVELNGDIVPKSQHTSTKINAGDTVEIVIAVGGG